LLPDHQQPSIVRDLNHWRRVSLLKKPTNGLVEKISPTKAASRDTGEANETLGKGWTDPLPKEPESSSAESELFQVLVWQFRNDLAGLSIVSLNLLNVFT
jgi:hypothetical protein